MKKGISVAWAPRRATRWLLALLLLSGVCGARIATGQALPAAASPNLVDNPGFDGEPGAELDGWGSFGIDAENTAVLPHVSDRPQGGAVLKLAKKNDDEYAFLWQRLEDKLAPTERTLYASAWFKVISAPGACEPYISIAVKKKETYEMVLDEKSIARKSPGWQKVSVKFKLPDKKELPDFSQVHVEVDIGIKGYGAAEVLVDDVYAGTKPR